MPIFEWCSDCGTGGRIADGRCIFCEGVHAAVDPGRVPMERALRNLAIGAAAIVAVVAVRVAVYFWRFSLAASLRTGDLHDRDAFHATTALGKASFVVLSAATLGFVYLTEGWTRLGHANALTRAEVGLRWRLEMATARRARRRQWATIACLAAVSLAAFGFGDDAGPDRVRLGAVLEIVFCVAYAVATVAVVRALRAATGELEAALESLEATDLPLTIPAPRSPQPDSPEPEPRSGPEPPASGTTLAAPTAPAE